MYKLSDSEWLVLEALWQNENMLLGDIVDNLYAQTKWSRNTVHTYLTRMEKKGLVNIDRQSEPHRYSYKVTRDDCSRSERQQLLNKVYGGSVGDLVAAFLKDSKITKVYGGSVGDLVAAFLKDSKITAEEKAKLNKLLDDMEV